MPEFPTKLAFSNGASIVLESLLDEFSIDADSIVRRLHVQEPGE